MRRKFVAATTMASSLLAALAAASPADATFHLMQIEQVCGGVGNDPAAQAIQLRMRASFQNLLGGARIRAWDASGANPVVIIDFSTSVLNGAAGARVLIASPAFVAAMGPSVLPDFQMTNLIPDCYRRAGSLTFESDTGIIYWRLSWGGSSYTGSNAGDPTNDADGNFGPPFPGPLDFRAVQFQGAASAPSTNNAADYASVAGASTWRTNAGAVGMAPDACPGDIDPVAGNGTVNINDLLHLLGGWGPCDAPCPPVCDSDLNGDAEVNINDLLDLLAGWGPC